MSFNMAGNADYRLSDADEELQYFPIGESLRLCLLSLCKQHVLQCVIIWCYIAISCPVAITSIAQILALCYTCCQEPARGTSISILAVQQDKAGTHYDSRSSSSQKEMTKQSIQH